MTDGCCAEATVSGAGLDGRGALPKLVADAVYPGGICVPPSVRRGLYGQPRHQYQAMCPSSSAAERLPRKKRVGGSSPPWGLTTQWETKDRRCKSG